MSCDIFWSSSDCEVHISFCFRRENYSFEEFIPIVKQIAKETDTGTLQDFMEAFKSFDREGMGYISLAEMRHMLTAMGDKLQDEELDNILEETDVQENLDGNIKFEDFIKKVLEGPPETGSKK